MDSDATLIAACLPAPALRQVDRVAVAAEPPRAWAAVRSADLYRIAFVRALFALRLLPDRLAAWVRRAPWEPDLSSRIDDITRPGSGFQLLQEEPGREVVVGAIGRFWQPSIPFVRVAPRDFTSFAEPGYGKLAWCLRVDPREGGGSWITVELRVGATDARSWTRFQRYWRLVGPFSHAIRHAMLRQLVAGLGAPPSDETRPLPGDELLPRRRFQKTHATTIEAPVERVWPWLRQMGARRAGWYSFDLLDNAGRKSAERILPELQELKVGDVIPALPKSAEGFAVARLEAPRVLVLGDPALVPGGRRSPDAPPWKTSWAFVLEPIGRDATRLTVRVRADFAGDRKMAVMAKALGVAHEVMERRQLHNLRTRAEARP